MMMVNNVEDGDKMEMRRRRRIIGGRGIRNRRGAGEKEKREKKSIVITIRKRECVQGP